MSAPLIKTNSYQIIILMLLVIIEVMGIGLVIPLLPALFVSPSSPIVVATTSISLRNFYYGVALGVWPLGMFFGTPFLGELSDKIGRRKIFITCLVLTAISYAFSAVAIIAHNIWLFFLSRLLAGFFAGSYEIAQAAAADLSTLENKARNMGWIILAMNLGFIAGPLITAFVHLSLQHTLLSLVLPFLIACGLALGNAGLVWRSLRETYTPQKCGAPFKLQAVFSSFLFVFSDARLKLISLISFLACSGWIAFFSGTPLLLSEYYHHGTKIIGAFFVSIGIAAAFVMLLQSQITKRFSLKNIVIYSLFLSSAVLIIIPLVSSFALTWVLAALFVLVEVISYAGILALASNTVNSDEQGKTMGGMAAISSIAFCFVSLLTGFVATYNIFFPLILGALFYFLSACFAAKVKTKP